MNIYELAKTYIIMVERIFLNVCQTCCFFCNITVYINYNAINNLR